MKKSIKILGYFCLVAILTIVTQIGGLIWIISILLSYRFKKNKHWKRAFLFLGIYLLATFFVVPLSAPLFGRVPLGKSASFKHHNVLTVLCNRNYVTPKTQKEFTKIADQFYKESGIQVVYFDANFPFMDNFPLLPHLSHDDGRKLDIGFIYKLNGKTTSLQPSWSGYGNFVQPLHQAPKTENCLRSNPFYDYPKYLTFGSRNDLDFDEKHTSLLLDKVCASSAVKKVFIEPHLKDRMNVSHKKVRFHGCKAVRHDDHIHIEFSY